MTEEELDNQLFRDLSEIIESGEKAVVSHISRTLTLVYWQVGRRINQEILGNGRAEYGKQIVSTVSKELEQNFGRSFSERNIRRMIQFSELFPDFEIVSPLATQLSWSRLEVVEVKDNYASK